MATFGIESNGRLEKTAIYFNGEQLGGVKEVFLNLDEDGTFDSIIQYEGTDKNLHTKSLFLDTLNNIRVTEPSFTDEDASELRLLEIDSNGDIENTVVFYNGEELNGLVNLYVHIKGSQSTTGIKSLFGGKKQLTDSAEFKAEFTFRNDDDSIETEAIF